MPNSPPASSHMGVTWWLARKLSHLVEGLLLTVGRRTPINLTSVAWWIQYGRWLRGTEQLPLFKERTELHRYVSEAHGRGAITFLEFGVADGDLIFLWARMNSDPGSRFVGFDTFTGLPSQWSRLLYAYPGGHFSRGGKPPETDDPRISWQVGLFDQTVGPYIGTMVESDRATIIHVDADLYNSTITLLPLLKPLIRDDTVWIFDDLGVPDHDFRALTTFCDLQRLHIQPLAFAGPNYRRAALRLQCAG